MAETAIVSLTNRQLDKLREKNPRLSKYIVFWENNYEHTITGIEIWLNLSIVALSVISSSIVVDINFFFYGLKEQGLLIQDILLPAISIVVTLTIGNLFPKTFARYNVEKISIIVLPIVVCCVKMLKAVVVCVSKFSNSLAYKISGERESYLVKADEIDFLLSNKTTSPLPDDSREIVSNIMDFAERRVSQVMTPRNELFTVNIDKGKNEIIKSIIDSQYSRVPVHRGNLSNIIGIIYSKDLALERRNSDIIIIQDLIRPVYYVPESAKISQILKEFKRGHHHCAIVVDEFGLTVGIVSIEDLLEEIVGEVLDEYDIEQDDDVISYAKFGRQEYLVQAQESVLDLNEKLGIEIPDGDYATVGGWILELFGKIPKTGETVIWKNFEIEIKEADKKQIYKVLLKCITK
jgi:CBS domain containing-hemolysin-like protein